MIKNKLTDMIYGFEIANKDTLVSLYKDGTITQEDIIKTANYFLKRLPDNHQLNGNTWNTMYGIISDYYEDPDPLERTVSHKQIWWLLHTLKENIHLRKPDDVFM